MATEEANSLPFLGSLMSLVSHGEIRYEGLLYQIDMPNSTIALSNVRCFGTEGRRKDGKDVPPSDQVFEYVVFKGSEIKELTVLQPPAPQPGFQDPAIVSAAPQGAGPPAPAPPPPGPPGYAPIPPAGGPSPWGPPPPYGTQFGTANPWSAPPPGADAPPPPRPTGQPAPAPAPTVAVAPAQQQQQPAPPTQRGPQQQQRPVGQANGGMAGGKGPTGSQQAPRIVPISYAHAAGGGRGAPGRGAPRGRGSTPQVRSHPAVQAAHRGGRGPTHGGGAGGAHTGVPRPPPLPPVEVPKEEFNFEEALKRFNKEEVLKEATEEVPSADGMAYSKDDFFDTMSCEALDRKQLVDSGEGRPDHRVKMAAMRKQDLETFGGMARGRSAGRGYGRGRGRGGGYGGNAAGGGGRGGRSGGRGVGAGAGGRGVANGRPARAEPAAVQ